MKLVPRFRKQWFAYLTVLCLALAAAVSFGVPAKAAENPQTSVSNTGKEADATKNQTSKADQVSAPYEGTGKTSKSLYGGQTELEKNIQTLQPSSIIGTDERTRISSTTSFPYRATVQLSIKYPNTSSTYGCTGF
ncbi:Glutamyl endopeptidase precursor, blaSE [Bacillus subtilis subsp. subtilis]|nr:Glutamyl endopeptidase precursor, blaSE [Bacillus subtilis subsp. subtilis]